MMKRILALLLAMVMSLTLLAGCGSTQPDDPVSDVKAVTVEKASFPLTIEDQRLDPPVAFGTVVPSGYNEDGNLLNGAFIYKAR